MRFTLKQIEYFVAAGETKSITIASERVNISQPSISAAIAHLEAEFGIQLFIRHHAQGLSLTPQGLRFLREAKALLTQAEELQAIAGELSDKITGPLSIGCLVTIYPLLVPEIVHTFRLRYTNSRIHAIAGDQAALIEKLRRGEISLALTYDLALPPDIEYDALAIAPPFIYVSAGHRLARRKSVPLEAMADEPFLMLDLPLSRDYFLSIFHQFGVVPRTVGEFEHIEVIRSLVARGDGFSLASIKPRNKASLDGRPLAYLDIEGNPRPLTLCLAQMRGARRTRSAECFAEVCRELVRDEQVPGAL